MLHDLKKYVLVTAAKNEEMYIEKTIKSVISQELKPEKWVIVNDDSTDATSDIIDHYTSKYNYIEKIDNIHKRDRTFASKAKALKIAFGSLSCCDYTYIGNLDADVTFEPNFYMNLIQCFEDDQSLGCIGGTIWEFIEGQWRFNHYNPDWCVGGATHFFRRAIFEKIGLYPELPYGGEDTVVEYLVRDAGYVVKAFTHLKVLHHKPSGPEFGKGIKKSFNLGRQEYYWGTSPLFQIFKCLKRITKKPYAFGAFFRFCGFIFCFFSNDKSKMVPQHIRRIVRKQQMQRLKPDLLGFLATLLCHGHKRVFSDVKNKV